MNREKSLHEMTSEELGKLFPIEIVDHNTRWSKLYQSESKEITKAAGKNNIEKIHHIGSTSIKSIKAKPTIDILLEIKIGADLEGLKVSLGNIGYEATVQKDNPPPHLTFYKGYAVSGFSGQVYHLHIRYKGKQSEITFRDYLKRHPQLIKEYEKLKLSLKDKFKFNREGYTDAKTEFINKVLKMADEQ